MFDANATVNPAMSPIHAGAVRSPRTSRWTVMRTLLAKDVRAAIVPISVVALLGALQAVGFAVDFGLSFDGEGNAEWSRAFALMQQGVRTAGYACCAVLPAWIAVELAFLEAGPGRRSVLPALPPSAAEVVASKVIVLVACVAVLATSVSCAFRWGPWSWPVSSAFALAGLASPVLARGRATGFAVAIGGPAAVFGASWAAGAGGAWSAAIAWLACAASAWVARGAVSGATTGDVRRLRRLGTGASGPASRDRAAVRPAWGMAALVRKDARAAAPFVAAALAFVVGFSLVAVALPAFGERLMQEFGIRGSDPVSRRLQVALPVALLAQLLVPGIVALVLAYCDGRAAGRPMAALPVNRGAAMASKVAVCLAAFALFSGIALVIHGLSSFLGDSFGERLLSADPEKGQLWAVLLLSAAGIPWCLALPAFVSDRRAGAVAAVVGVPLLLFAFGLAMQWAIRGWYDLITVRLLGVREWPMWLDADHASFGRLPPVVTAWLAVGIVAAAVAAPVVTASASSVRIRGRAVRAVAIAAAAATAVASLAYVLPEIPLNSYQEVARKRRTIEQAMNKTTLEALVQRVVVRQGNVPDDPVGGFGPDAKYDAAVAPLVLDAVLTRSTYVAASFWAIERSRPGQPPLLALDPDKSYTPYGPMEVALAVRAVREPTAAERELRRLVDDPRIGGGVRIAAASWLGPVPAAMAAARVVADSPSVTERAFAIAVLAHLRYSLSEGRLPDDRKVGLEEYDAGYMWCWLRTNAINSLLELERRSGDGDAAVPFVRRGIAPDCAVDGSIVRRALDRVERGPSDLCDMLRALGNSGELAWPRFGDATPIQSASIEIQSACDCLLRVAR
ncbi:MAG: hypothetical protein ACKOGH_19575 [Alphaproteobacteria bacterium]